MAGGSGATVTNYNNSTLGDVAIHMPDGAVFASNSDAKAFGQSVQELIEIEMVKETRRGGLLDKITGRPSCRAGQGVAFRWSVYLGRSRIESALAGLPIKARDSGNSPIVLSRKNFLTELSYHLVGMSSLKA